MSLDIESPQYESPGNFTNKLVSFEKQNKFCDDITRLDNILENQKITAVTLNVELEENFDKTNMK